MQKRVIKTERRSLPVRLTAEELDQCSRDMAIIVREESWMERNHADIKDTLRAEKKDLDSRKSAVAQKINTETEHRMVKVVVVLNDIDGTVESVRDDTLEVLDSRPQTQDERQSRIPGTEPKTLKAGKSDDDDLPTRIHRFIHDHPKGLPWEAIGEEFKEGSPEFVTASVWAMIHSGEIEECADASDEECESTLFAPNESLRYDILAMLMNQPEIGTEKGVSGGGVDLIPLKGAESDSGEKEGGSSAAIGAAVEVAKLSGEDLRKAYERETGKKPGRMRDETLRLKLLAARSG